MIGIVTSYGFGRSYAIRNHDGGRAKPLFQKGRHGIGSLPGELYLSVDMDVLSEDYARTDWDQGDMSLESLCRTVRDISCSGRLAGADICGGIGAEKGGTQADFELNSRCTGAILEALGASRE